MTQTGVAGFVGSRPVLTHGITEHEKYRRLWHDHPEYRAVAPGEQVAQTFLQVAKPAPDAEVIDFGCGTGRGALMLALFGGMRVHMLDFVDGCLDPEIKDATINQPTRITFREHNLRKPVPIAAQYGYCTDVMEHIPPGDVSLVLFNVLKAARHVFFQISTAEDHCGKLIGHPLHLSVHPYGWWLDRFRELGCMIHWSQELPHACMFYVSSWQDGKEAVKNGTLNNSDDAMLENVKANVAKGFQQVVPHMTNDLEIMILNGGPSLNDSLPEIKNLIAAGVKVVTVNGAYNWAIERGIHVSAQVMVDSREFNKRFVSPIEPDCKYLIASQCHPSVFEQLPADRTYIWHASWSQAVREYLNTAYEAWFSILGGSTVGLRAISVMRTLGFKSMHLFGFDSCLREDAHHAYAQPENDSEHVISVTVSGGKEPERVFKCHAWMLAQANEFLDLIKSLGNEIELEVYGDGLIAWILKTGATIADNDKSSQQFEL